MKKSIFMIVALSFMTSTAFAAECAPQDLNTKITDFQSKYMKLLEANPSKAAKWAKRAQDMAKDAQTIKPTELCDYYGNLIKEVEADM